VGAESGGVPALSHRFVEQPPAAVAAGASTLERQLHLAALIAIVGRALREVRVHRAPPQV
jgi:hypothetical protein